MEKRCPRCGELFPGTAQYCDQDGTQLVPSGAQETARPGGVRRRPVLVWTVVGLLLLGLGVLAPFLWEAYVRAGIEVSLIDVRFPGQPLAGADDPGPEEGGVLSQVLEGVREVAESVLGEGRLDVRLRVENHTLVPVSVRGARYRVAVGEQPAVPGEWRPEDPLPCAPGEAVEIEFEVTPEPGRGGTWSFKGGSPAVEVTGEVAVQALLGTVDVAFEGRHLEIEVQPQDSTIPAAYQGPAGW